MTEAEWEACADPTPMLEFLRGKASDRKLRLFAVACCRRLLQKVRLHPWYANGVGVVERFADGQAATEDLLWAGQYPHPDWSHQYAPAFDYAEIAAGGQPVGVTKLAINACWNAMEVEDEIVLADCCSENAAWAITQPGSVMPDDNGVSVGRLRIEKAIHTGILRDVAGNPFRPVALDPSWVAWNDGAVPKMAGVIYDERAFDRLPLLADALEAAGCTDAAILAHCREPGEHVRGCWVVDLLLGKS